MLLWGLRGAGGTHMVKEMNKSLLSSPLFSEASRNPRAAWNPVRQPQVRVSEFELWSQVDLALASDLCSVFPSCESEASLLICLFIFTSEDN